MNTNPGYIGNYFSSNVQQFIHNQNESKSIMNEQPSGWKPFLKNQTFDIVPEFDEQINSRLPKSCNNLQQINTFDESLHQVPLNHIIFNEVSRGGLNTSNFIKDKH